MKVIIDSNRVIAALIKDSTTRTILFDDFFEFFAPAMMNEEIEKYREDIMQKSKLAREEFEKVLALCLENITIIAQERYRSLLDEMKQYASDAKDISYIAVCSFIDAEGIWTHDPHFMEQKKFKILTNIDMLKASGRANE